MSTLFNTIGLINPHGDDGFEGKQSSSNSNQPTGIKNRVSEGETERTEVEIVRDNKVVFRAGLPKTACGPNCFFALECDA